MKSYLLPLSVIVLLLAGYYFFTDPPKREISYSDRLENHRLEMAYFMRADQQSPFGDSIKFEGLDFFAPDESFKVLADFLPLDEITKVQVPTTDGKMRDYFRYGHLIFELKGQQQRLLVYRSADPGKDELFLGFTDPTNGETSYGGGRYLDITQSSGGPIILDFNYAYNPYCAYNPDYSCPIPPRENRISVPVTAGEKKYGK